MDKAILTILLVLIGVMGLFLLIMVVSPDAMMIFLDDIQNVTVVETSDPSPITGNEVVLYPTRHYDEQPEWVNNIPIYEGETLGEYVPTLGGYHVKTKEGHTVVRYPIEQPSLPYDEGTFSISPVGYQRWPVELSRNGNYFVYGEYPFVCLVAPSGTPIKTPLRSHEAQVSNTDSIVIDQALYGVDWVVVRDSYYTILMAKGSQFEALSDVDYKQAFLLDDYVVGYSDGGCLQVAIFENKEKPVNNIDGFGEIYYRWRDPLLPADGFKQTNAPVTEQITTLGVAYPEKSIRIGWPVNPTQVSQPYPQQWYQQGAYGFRDISDVVCVTNVIGSVVVVPEGMEFTNFWTFEDHNGIDFVAMVGSGYRVVMKGVSVFDLLSSPLAEKSEIGVTTEPCVEIGVWQMVESNYDGFDVAWIAVNPQDVFGY